MKLCIYKYTHGRRLRCPPGSAGTGSSLAAHRPAAHAQGPPDSRARLRRYGVTFSVSVSVSA